MAKRRKKAKKKKAKKAKKRRRRRRQFFYKFLKKLAIPMFFEAIKQRIYLNFNKDFLIVVYNF